MITSSERLLAEFPAHTYEQWHAAAQALLKGADFNKRLVARTHENITIQPIYRREDIAGLAHLKELPGQDSLVRGSTAGGHLGSGWEVSQELRADHAGELNERIHEALNGGQTELNLVTGCGQSPCCTGGTSLKTAADITTALQGVALDAISTYWQSGPSCIPMAALYLAAVDRLGFDAGRLRGGFENDPLAELASKGVLRQPLASRYSQMAALTRYTISKAPRLQTITAKGDVYHNAGASATQELGYTLATLITHIEQLRGKGLAPADILPRVRIRLSVGSDYFMEIAKFRAARWLWSRIADAYGVDPLPVHLHASTSRWNKTCYDAHTNMLRVTAEAFAAVVAGVDSLHIGTYDEVVGSHDEFSRRIARNLHTILREECGLDRVIDPAGGSYYIEWLTDQVAAQSWQILQDIESRGGMIQCLSDGSVQQAITAVREAKFSNIRQRKERIVGANMYPDLKGNRLEGPQVECSARHAPVDPPAPGITVSADAEMIGQAVAAALDGASKSAITSALAAGDEGHAPTVEALGAHRAAQQYEALRDASAAHARSSGRPPTILQLNMGPSRKYRLRADWTAAFFQAAGFEVDGARDFSSTREALDALSASHAPIAVITSDDEHYLQIAAALAASAKAARPELILLLAGAPGEHEAAWREAGIDEFVNVRSNNHELNHSLLQRIGVI